ncbi:hypothetical protein, partial [Xanthomonas sp. GPE 39]|uniref:hypothetical protein n=1 Tax=Xanthomonas sp. GPE 39 TaxID=1583099 RepID=UPI001F43C51B
SDRSVLASSAYDSRESLKFITRSKPVWPDNGIAQRMLPNASMMFVENEHGKLRAWVVSEPPGGDNVEALDFFTGQKIKVKVAREKDGRQYVMFTDGNGILHAPEDKKPQASVNSMPMELAGISLEGSNLSIKNKTNGCYVRLNSTISINDANSKSAKNWSKFPIYHSMSGPKNCTTGSFHSEITSALDLNDGTFLAIEGCFVFRLRKSDLSPIGLAPALRIVDEKEVRDAIAKIKNENIQDATGYLADTLKLPTVPGLSCKED